MQPRILSFAQQRIMFAALLLGMTAYMICVAVVLYMNDGQGMSEAPDPNLDTAAIAIGATITVMAFVVRMIMRRRAATLSGARQNGAQFASVIIPIAMLEGGNIFATTIWLLNGNAVPNLVAALVLLAIATAIVPLQAPRGE